MENFGNLSHFKRNGIRNFAGDFGVGLLDDSTRHFQKRTFGESPSGKAPKTLVSSKMHFSKDARFRNRSTFYNPFASMKPH